MVVVGYADHHLDLDHLSLYEFQLLEGIDFAWLLSADYSDVPEDLLSLYVDHLERFELSCSNQRLRERSGGCSSTKSYSEWLLCRDVHSPPGCLPIANVCRSDSCHELESAATTDKALVKGAPLPLSQQNAPLPRLQQFVWSFLDGFGLIFALFVSCIVLLTSWSYRLFSATFCRRLHTHTEYITANGEVYKLPAAPLVLALNGIPKAENVPGVAYGARRRKAGRADMVGGAARAVKAALGGTPERTGANQLVANTMLLKWLRGQGIRDTDAMGYLPFAIELVFTKTAEEVAAAAWSTSRDLTDYHKALTPCGNWWTRLHRSRICSPVAK